MERATSVAIRTLIEDIWRWSCSIVGLDDPLLGLAIFDFKILDESLFGVCWRVVIVGRSTLSKPSVSYLTVYKRSSHIRSVATLDPVWLNRYGGPHYLAMAAALRWTRQIEFAIWCTQYCARLIDDANHLADFIVLSLMMVVSFCLQIPIVVVREVPDGVIWCVWYISHCCVYTETKVSVVATPIWCWWSHQTFLIAHFSIFQSVCF